MSADEKKALMRLLTCLSPGDLNKALLIIAHDNPNFELEKTEVELDLDDQNESTLWKLKFFAKDALEAQRKSVANMASNNDNNDAQNNNNNKRKREIRDALAKTNQMKNKNLT